MAFSHTIFDIEVERRFLSGTKEVMDDTESVDCVELRADRSQSIELGNQIRTDTREIGSCVLDAFLIHRDRHVFILND